MGFFVGAYAASPCQTAWDPAAEGFFYEGLRALEGVQGLEHPFYGGIHRWDGEWFLENLGPRWTLLLTCIPGTMDRMAKDPSFGLASEDPTAALIFAADANNAVRVINEAAGRPAVAGVMFHSAPRRVVPTSRDVFARNLETMGSWDWGGAQLLVEHCDAYIEGQKPDKGFLTLEDELWAMERAGPWKMLVNWGRSALEGRSAERPLEHVRRCGSALGGLMFSGVSDADWRDRHAPFSTREAGSLMTPEEAGRCLEAARPPFVGLKVKPDLAAIEDGLGILRRTSAR